MGTPSVVYKTESAGGRAQLPPQAEANTWMRGRRGKPRNRQNWGLERAETKREERRRSKREMGGGYNLRAVERRGGPGRFAESRGTARARSPNRLPLKSKKDPFNINSWPHKVTRRSVVGAALLGGGVGGGAVQRGGVTSPLLQMRHSRNAEEKLRMVTRGAGGWVGGEVGAHRRPASQRARNRSKKGAARARTIFNFHSSHGLEQGGFFSKGVVF
jgi:hypothetical protein